MLIFPLVNDTSRKIIHIDMDAFFASVEERDNPQLKGKPVIIGHDPRLSGGRGVVSTCNYEARKYGVHSVSSGRFRPWKLREVSGSRSPSQRDF